MYCRHRTKENNIYVSNVKNKTENVDGSSTFPADATYSKGYGRVSRVFILVCIFAGYISLFVFHTWQGLSSLNLNDGETQFTASSSKSSDRKMPFSVDENNMILEYISFIRLIQMDPLVILN